MMIDKRLLAESGHAKKYIMKQVLVQWLGLLLNIGIVYTMAELISNVWQQTLTVSRLNQGSFFILVLLLLRMLSAWLSTHYSYKASEDIKVNLRIRLYQKLLALGSGYRRICSTSELVQLSSEGCDQLETYFGRYLPQFFYSMLAPCTLFILLVFIDWKSALVLLICVPLIPISIVAVQKFAKKLLAKYWTSYTTLGDSFLENLQGLTTLKIYQADGYKNDMMNKEAEQFRKITMKVLTMQLNSISVMDIVACGGAAVGSITALIAYANGSLSLWGVLVILMLSAEFFLPLRLLGSFFHIAMNGIAASEKLFKILDYEITEQPSGKLDNAPISIQLKHVNFSYDESRQILKDINMEIQAGQFAAIVGESGSGKSTLASLLMGLEKSSSGAILFNNQNRETLNDTEFWKHVTYVGHECVLFKGSVRDNLTMGKTIDDEALSAVLKQVQLYDFIMSQQGLDTQLLEQASNLSGGQRQRLGLARALLKDSEIYLFDEATSSIDVESEDAILQVIRSLAKTKTVIMITHRLANVKECDIVYVMQEGRIAEAGSHEKLLANQSVYAQYYQKQQELETFTKEADHE